MTDSQRLSDVELVIVAYRSRPQVEELFRLLPDDVAVVVVDNSDGSDGLGDLVQARPRSRYLSGGGVGFARAANAGARSSTAEYLVFINPDTRPTTAQLATLVGDVATDPHCAASAAVGVGPDGQPRIGVGGWEFSPRRAAVHAVGLHKLLPRAGLFAKPAAGEDIDVDWVSGAVMAVRRETFLRLGCFDESFYVYCEDVGLGRQARAAGMTERLRTDVLVTGSSGGSGAPSLEMMRLRGASLNRYARKHNGALRGGLIGAFTSAGYAVRALVHLMTRGGRTREHWAYAVGAATARATVAGRVVTDR